MVGRWFDTGHRLLGRLVRRLGAGLEASLAIWVGASGEPRPSLVDWSPAGPGTWCRRCGRVFAEGAPGPSWLGRRDAKDPLPSCGRACRPIGDLVVVLGADVPPLDGWVRAVKRSGGRPDLGWWLGRRLGEQLRGAAGLDAGGTLVVVPVPSAGPRRLGRGIDHTAILAGGLAAACRGRVVRGVLRHGGGRRQAGRSRADRLRAAPDTIRMGRKRVPHGATVVLVDDIRTTGATLRAAAARLREAGADRVVVAVLAARDRSPDASSPEGDRD